STPPLPRLACTRSQALSRFFRLYTLSINEWTFLAPVGPMSIYFHRGTILTHLGIGCILPLCRAPASTNCLPLPRKMTACSPHDRPDNRESGILFWFAWRSVDGWRGPPGVCTALCITQRPDSLNAGRQSY